MKISYNWLKTLIDPKLSLEELCEKLTMSGLEVEHITPIESIKGGLKDLVVGEVIEKSKHPNADKLSLTKVTTGSGEALSIVCGAPNVEVGQKVVVAPVGCTIHPLKSESFEIKKAKIRGELSEGMLCAEDEIGLGESHNGILVLPKETKIGLPLKELYKIESDYQIEIAIIPNRGDAISHLGVAREIQALTGVRYKQPGTTSFDARGQHRVDIEIADNVACPRYGGISMKDVKVGPSSELLQKRLKSIGLNPINNIVDITNYIQHEIGQPMHAFDLDKIEGKKIIVRKANKDETLITLDEVERKLSEDHLVIADKSKALALAGILGGMQSGVSDKTKNIFLEVAYFNPSSIRKTAKEFGLNTDSSYRFERGTDPNITEYALRRAVNLIQKEAGGELASEIVDIYPNPIPDTEIAINLVQLNKFTGHAIPKDDVIAILQNLEIHIAANNGDNLMLKVPPYRPDVKRPVDIYEEILRVYGFDNIPIPKKVNYIPSVISEKSPNKLQQKISDYLAAQGMFEMLSNSLTSSEYYSEAELEMKVEMLNPLSKEMDIMRMNLLDSALESISYNINRKNADIKFFEFGKTYRNIKGKYIEDSILQLTSTGRKHSEHWNTTDDKLDAYHLRGIAENCLKKLNIPEKHFDKLIQENTISKQQLKKHQIKQEVVSLSINWDRCVELCSDKFELTEIPKFPVVRRDLSLVVDQNVSFKEIKNLAKQNTKNYLKDLKLFDVYEGKPLKENQRSLALAYYLYDTNKTMEDKEIDAVMDKLISVYENKLNATIRR